MKKIAFTLTLLVAKISFAGILDVGLKMEGEFKKAQPVYMFNYTKKACIEDRGRFMRNGSCLFKDGGSTVTINKTSADSYMVSIGSVGTNGHMCDFQGHATKLNQVQLVAREGDCEVTIGFTNQDTLAVWNNGLCEDYCGHNMNLDIKDAKRNLKK